MITAILDVVEGVSGLSGVTFRFGSRWLAELVPPPRVVWVPTRDTLEDPTKRCHPKWTDIYARYVGIDAHVWGASYEQCEAVIHNLLTACQANFPGVYRVGGVVWIEAGQGRFLERGVVGILGLSFGVPVLDKYVTVPTTAEVEAALGVETEQPTATTTVELDYAVIGDKEYG